MKSIRPWREGSLLGLKVFTRIEFGPADPRCLNELRLLAGGWLPPEYVDAMLDTDGFEGVIGASPESGCFFRLFGCEYALRATAGYRIREFEPNMFLLGSDGGGTAYLIDGATREWIELPFLDFGSTGEGRLERRFPTLRQMLETLVQEQS